MKLTNKAYDILKWTCLIGLPALSVLTVAIGNIWNLPYTEIVATIDAVGIFIGTLIGISTKSYYSVTKSDKDIDGE